jgi:RHS repeat-associated protein
VITQSFQALLKRLMVPLTYNNGVVITLGYDAASRLISTTYPDQTVITNAYDDLNHITSIEEYALFTYTPDSLLSTLTYNNGVVTTLGYDQRHRPLSIRAEKEGELLLSLGYTYDAVGNTTAIMKEWIDPVTYTMLTANESYTYDSIDRLTTASNGFGTLSFEYDAVGNRTKKIVNGEEAIYTYSLYDRLSTAGEWVFDYDSNGNTISKADPTEEWLFQYDARDELVHVELNEEVMGTYVYDGNGNRIKKTEWNQTSQQYETIIYIYSKGKVCYEKNMTTELEGTYIYGPAGRIAKKVGEEVMYYHTDHLGSTRLMTSASGNPITAIEYYPFGYSQLSGESERYSFTGQEMDSTGLYYLKARYYDPETGRFLTEDRGGCNYSEPQTLNKYVYCFNNPLRYTDPTGKGPPRGSTLDIDPDELATNASNDSEEGENSTEEIDWGKLGLILGFFTGQKITNKLLDNPLGMNYQNSSFAISKKALEAFEEVYGLEGEDLEKFEAGFKEGVNKGTLHKAEEIEEMFEGVEGEVKELIAEVNETVVIALAFDLLNPIPAELFPKAWAVAESASAIDTLATAIENIPEPEQKQNESDAGLGGYMIVLGMIASILIRRKTRRRVRVNSEQFQIKEKEVRE